MIFNKILDFVGKKFEIGELDNNSLVQLIELCGSYLGLKTIAQKAKELNTDYNNVKKSALPKVELFNVKFIIDNE